MKTSWKIKLKCTKKSSSGGGGGVLLNVCHSCIPKERQGEGGGRGIHSLLSEDEEADEGVRTYGGRRCRVRQQAWPSSPSRPVAALPTDPGGQLHSRSD